MTVRTAFGNLGLSGFIRLPKVMLLRRSDVAGVARGIVGRDKERVRRHARSIYVACLHNRGMGPSAVNRYTKALDEDIEVWLGTHPRRGKDMPVTVLIPIYEPNTDFLESALKSVYCQSYTNWEVLLVCDGPPAAQAVLETPRLRDLLTSVEVAAANNDKWLQSPLIPGAIRLLVCTPQSGIQAATSAGLFMVRGDATVLLDQDDLLQRRALEVLVRSLQDFDAIYSDHRIIDERGRVLEVFRKPAWSPTLAQQVLYMGHVKAFKTSALVEFYSRIPAEGLADHFSMLQMHRAGARIGHVPLVLAAWRRHQKSVAYSHWVKPEIRYEFERGMRLLLGENSPVSLRARPESHVLDIIPKGHVGLGVTVIIPTAWVPKTVEKLIRRVLEDTPSAVRCIVVDSRPCDRPSGLEQLSIEAKERLQILEWNRDFNYAAVNNMASEQVDTPLMLLLNDDTLPLTPSWLEDLVSVIEWTGAEVVGAQLRYPDGRIQHGGVALGPRGTADHMYRHHTTADGRAWGSSAWTREVSAVTGACLLTRTETYRRLGGLSTDYLHHYEDLDFCLRVRASGGNIIQAQLVQLIHLETATRSRRYCLEDRATLISRWQNVLDKEDFAISSLTTSSH